MNKAECKLNYVFACLIAAALPVLTEAADVKSGFWYVYSNTSCGGMSYFKGLAPAAVADKVCSNVKYEQRVCAGWPDSEVAGSPPSVYASADGGNYPIYKFSCTNQVVPGPEGRYALETDTTGRPKDLGPPKCVGVGNPINSSTGNKYEEIQITKSFGRRSLDLRISYNSLTDGDEKAFGHNWHHSYESRVYPTSLTFYPATSVLRSDGRVLGFKKSGSAWIGSSDSMDKLEELLDTAGVTTGWRYTTSSEEIENYSAAGILLSVTKPNGISVAMTYSDGTAGSNGGYVLDASGAKTNAVLPTGLLIRVTNQFDGSAATFGYDASSRVVNFLDAAENSYGFKYDESSATPTTVKSYFAGNVLTSIKYPDGTTRTLWYNEQDKTAGTNLPNALTGIVDENGVRFATWYYNSGGKAISSEHAGGVEKYGVSYLTSNNTSSAVLDPFGSQSTYSFTTLYGTAKPTGKSQPAGSGCSASASSVTYDANGNVARQDDFNGTRACYTSDLTRNLETTRVEGLAKTVTCSAVSTSNVSLPTGSRKISTTWHPDRRLKVKRAAPGHITTSIYNGQPDPFNANAVAWCAPSNALLPDGKPIAVLCKEVEQATTDADGHLGFSATLQSGVVNRVQQWTYNGYGQVLTATDPLNHTTTYSYYGDTTADHMMGDLQSVTNALGQSTTYTQYDKHGNLLQSTDPNGVVTLNTYDLRQRLLSTSVGEQTTSYTYDAVGQLTRITHPDANWTGFEYDAAHRQTAVLDNLGNRIEYTLDNLGNRTAEAVKDPAGTLSRQLSRSIDALGRIQRVTGVAP